MPFPVGKLPPEILKKWLARIPIRDERVIVGPRYGEDCAVIDFGDRYLIAKTDPVTLTAYNIGWYAVNVNANDVATTGARPRWFLATLLLPERYTDEALVDDIFGDIIRSCEELGVTLCGGHVEVTRRLRQPILVGQMLGEVAKDKLCRLSNARPGDKLLLTKGIAIEGTSIIALELGSMVRDKLGKAFRRRATDFVHTPGISVVKEALIAAELDGVRAMHDPTEGGLAAALAEVAYASGTGLRVRRDAIVVYPECRTLCETFGLDPLGLIASGALLIVVCPESSDRVAEAIRSAGIPCAEIGVLTEPQHGLILETDRGPVLLESSSTDQITHAL